MKLSKIGLWISGICTVLNYIISNMAMERGDMDSANFSMILCAVCAVAFIIHLYGVHEDE